MSALAEAGTTLPPARLISRREQRSLAVRLSLALATAGLLLLSLLIDALVPGQQDVAELVAGAAALIVAVPAIAAAWHSLRHPDLHGLTDQLVGLAVIAAWAVGDLTTAALLPLIMTIGHVLEERSLLGSREAIQALGRLTAMTARRRMPDGGTEDVDADALRPGDVVEIRPGDRIPADGIVARGRSSVDSAAITGESLPAEVAPGAVLYAGSLNLDGGLLVEVTRVGRESTLGRVVALMQTAERAKPPVSRLLERYAGRYMTLVLLAAAASWFATGSTTVLLTVLVASCPCALVLAAPATAIAAIAVAARHGILVKGAAFLENLATVDSLVLDKTGTVTLGQLRLAEVRPEPGVDADELCRVAAMLGAASNHPVSRAVAHLADRGDFSPVVDVREQQGLGVTGRWRSELIGLGRSELFSALAIEPSAPPAHDGPVAGVSRGEKFLGWVLLADELRPEAREAIADLRALGLRRQILLTGDRAAVARRIAASLDIADVRAEALPQDKLDCILAEKRAGFRPLVVGDGINDALALKAGAVGIAMGAQGIDVALASADIVLMTNNLRRLGTCLRLSRRCRGTIHVSVALGLGWTVVIVGCAAAGLLGASGPLIAAVVHNIGTLLVMANAGRLLKFQEPGDAGAAA